MGDHAEQLARRSLLDVTLPGTHDSAAYKLSRRIMPGTLPLPLWLVVQLAADAGISAADYVIHWALTQDASISEQLDAGIRFLDLRAGWNGTTWVTCHTAEGPALSGCAPVAPSGPPPCGVSPAPFSLRRCTSTRAPLRSRHARGARAGCWRTCATGCSRTPARW